MGRAGSQDRAVGRTLSLLSLLAVSGAMLIATVNVAGATRVEKDFSASIDPASVGSSEVDKTFHMTFTNENPTGSTIGIGSIRVTIPGGFTGVADIGVTPPEGKNWNHSLGSAVIDLSANTGQDKLFAGESLVLGFTATTPCLPDDYEWTTQAWVATDFTSSVFRLKQGATQPTVTVEAGTAATRLDITSTTDASGNAFPQDVDGHLYVEQGTPLPEAVVPIGEDAIDLSIPVAMDEYSFRRIKPKRKSASR